MKVKYKLLLSIGLNVVALLIAVYLIDMLSLSFTIEVLIKICFVVLTILIIAYNLARVLAPLNLIVDAAKGISYGNYDVSLDIKTKDEFGTFASSLNRTVEALHEMLIDKKMEEGAAIKRIKSAKTLVEHIRQAGMEITSCATQMMAITEQQASGASEQSSAVTETSSTMEELSRTASAIADNAYNVTRAAERTLLEMKEVSIKVTGATKKILALGEKSQTIGKIIAMIDDLSAQTNLLALNAAIEAARAGEAGRGFAVVASEVRKLAERSVESTEEIRQVINEIQAETNSVVMGIEESTRGVAEGLQMVEDTAKVSKEISLATQQQKTASNQVAEAMKNVDTVTKQFAVSAKQSVASASTLQNLSDNLKQVVIKFTSEMGGIGEEPQNDS